LPTIERSLDRAATALGLISRDYRKRGYQIDRVWWKDLPLLGRIPILAFEIEKSAKPLKYLKGDIVNLERIGCEGVIVLDRGGFGAEYRNSKRQIESIIKQRGCHISVWSEKKVIDLLDILNL
jgi:hypothetical protein